MKKRVVTPDDNKSDRTRQKKGGGGRTCAREHRNFMSSREAGGGLGVAQSVNCQGGGRK